MESAPDGLANAARQMNVGRVDYAGGRDNSVPGFRKQSNPDYYAAFVVDPDGYRIEAYCGPAER